MKKTKILLSVLLWLSIIVITGLAAGMFFNCSDDYVDPTPGMVEVR